MSETITIDPLTRIEGHATITLHLNDEGRVADARFHVTQLRGFEKLCEGRPFWEMPSLMARICGICPVSHLLASAKACDAILAVQIPPAARLLRRVLNLAQVLQSHALSFFYLSSPDVVLGLDADAGTRSIFGLLASHPDLARDGIRLRQFGQQTIERLGGKRIHPAWVVPGGVSAPLSAGTRDAILGEIPAAIGIVRRTLEATKPLLRGMSEAQESFGTFPSLFMGLVGERESLELYDGALRMGDAAGNTVVPRIDPARYGDDLAEAVEPWSFLKSPYYRRYGYPAGMYRVGPLARLNLVREAGTPLADVELAEFKVHGPVLASFQYHHARLIEMLHAAEKMQQLLEQPDATDAAVRAYARPNNAEGIGISEAPRGTLIHHYTVDEGGLVRSANLVIATGHNNLAMNRAILQAAQRFVDGHHLTEGMLNRVEAVIRAFDPCLSCSTHAAGRMPLKVEMVAADGTLLSTVTR